MIPTPEARSFLFLGGPWDGQVRALQGEHVGRPVAVAETESIRAWQDGEPVRLVPVEIRKRYYRHERIALFGALLSVYVDEALTPPERDERAREWLLSPLAKGFLS